MEYEQQKPTPNEEGNQNCITKAKNQAIHKRSKYIEPKRLFIREKDEDKTICLI